MAIEEILARYATGAAALVLVVAMAAGRAVSEDGSFRKDLRGAQGYLLAFLATAFVRFLTPVRWNRLDKWLYVAGLVLFAFGALRGAAATWSVLHRRRTGIETPRILRDLVDAVLFLLAVIVILQATLDVNLSALLASSAVISLVLGLALQETLGNLFAGLSLQAERPFTEGDWVKIGPHQGKVLEVGWRATRLLGGAGESLTIPNNAVAKEAVYNLTRRGAALRKVTLSLGYGVPPNAVKEVALSLVRSHPRVLPDPAPAVRVADFGQAAIAYDVVFWVARFEVGAEVEDDVRSQLWYRLHRAGLTLSAVGNEVRLARSQARPPGTEEIDVAALFQRVAFLQGLDPAARLELAQRARVVRFGRGEAILRPGQRSSSEFYVVADGDVELRVRMPSGEELEAARLLQGDVFGDMETLAGEPRTASVVAVGEVTAKVVTRDALERELGRASWAGAFVKALAERFRDVDDRLEKMRTGRA